MIRLALIEIAIFIIKIAIKMLGHVYMHDAPKVKVWLFLGRVKHNLWLKGFNLRFELIRKGIIK